MKERGVSGILPRAAGEGDHAKHGGGGLLRPQLNKQRRKQRTPSTALRAVPLPRAALSYAHISIADSCMG